MVAIRDPRERISRFGWRELRKLWDELLEGTAIEWEPGEALEYLVLRAFELDGAEVRWPYDVVFEGQVMEQIDGAVYCDGLACLVECKDTTRPVNATAIAKLRSQLLRRPAGTVGMLFSRSGFTEPAVALAQFASPQAVLLWFPEEMRLVLDQGRMRQGLMQKFRKCVEEGVVDHKITMRGAA